MNDEVFTIRARRCKRCGRLLTSKEAVEKGYGCQCAEKVLAEEREAAPLPGQMTIYDLIKNDMED
jgi:DNA-directed RNA polymerase subunit RPC12/RpoP